MPSAALNDRQQSHGNPDERQALDVRPRLGARYVEGSYLLAGIQDHISHAHHKKSLPIVGKEQRNCKICKRKYPTR
jgi:hypothetical protein